MREHGVSSGLYYAMVDKAYGHRLHPKTLEKLVNLKWMQTDHLNSKLCDDPANFFLLFAPVNNFFSFEKLFHYKKEWSGDAYRAVVRFEHAAVEERGPPCVRDRPGTQGRHPTAFSPGRGGEGCR